MKISERPSLKHLNTFGVDARAGLRIDIESEEDILALPVFDPGKDLVLGGGSNILLVTDVPGTVFLNRIPGRQVVEESNGKTVVEVGGGENWHDLVSWSVSLGYSGIENLALIPGCVGAAPIQNIGAYGVELASVIESVTAWDWQTSQWRVFKPEECRFAYRDSLFKTAASDRYLITSLRIRLSREFTPRISYAGLEGELVKSVNRDLTPQAVFEAVVRIRQKKLPSPEKIGNAGSFFKNPVIDDARAGELQQNHAGLPGWPAGNGKTKLSAAWMIEHCGLKGHRNGPVGVSDQHALVLVNHGGGSGVQLWQLAKMVQQVVASEFDLVLEPEPRIFEFEI